MLSGLFNIQLASKTIQVSRSGNIDWLQTFEDQEDNESLHRWNWLLTLCTSSQTSDLTSAELGRWTQEQIERWFKHFLPEIKNKKSLSPKPDRWQSYSIAERLSNFCLFFERMRLKPKRSLLQSLTEMGSFLSYNLEYLGKNTGNHVFNNARGLYILGTALGLNRFAILGKRIILRETSNLVTEEGFLREGSSHYQFLFTRWTMELKHFSLKTQDRELTQFLSKYENALKMGCQFFLISNKQGLSYPKFGDISPDFTPQWLVDVPFTNINSNERVIPNEKWSGLFPTSSMVQNNGGEAFFKKSGWFRVDQQEFTFLTRLEQDGVASHVGHFHDDILHFTLHYKNRPLLIDTGRKNYIMGDPNGEVGLFAEAHNSILIDGLGPTPKRRTRLPHNYFKKKGDVQKRGNSLSLKTHAFERLKNSVEVIRHFRFEEKLFSIKDELKPSANKGVSKASIFFHWDRNIKIKRRDDWSFTFESPYLKGLFLIENKSFISGVFLLPENHKLSYSHEEYGISIPSPCLQIEASIEGLASLKYTLKLE